MQTWSKNKEMNPLEIMNWKDYVFNLKNIWAPLDWRDLFINKGFPLYQRMLTKVC